MRSYREVVASVDSAIDKGEFSFKRHSRLDYTGVGFGYNLKESYPKTWAEADADTDTSAFKEFVRGCVSV